MAGRHEFRAAAGRAAHLPAACRQPALGGGLGPRRGGSPRDQVVLAQLWPATHEHLHYWLGEGLSAGRKRLQGWLADLDDELVALDVEGGTAYVVSEDVDALMAARPTKAVRFLPGHDPWVMGPGTSDEQVVPPRHRTAVTRKANLVIAGGVVSGTWSTKGSEVVLAWFEELGPPPRKALAEQVDRLSGIIGRPLRWTLDVA